MTENTEIMQREWITDVGSSFSPLNFVGAMPLN